MAINTGSYVIVRTRDAGVHAGTYVSHSGREVVLTDSRRLWRWWSQFTLSELSQSGVPSSKVSEVRFATVIPNITLLEACEIIECSEVGAESIQSIVPFSNEIA